MKRRNIKTRDYTTLLQDCFPDIKLKENIDQEELKVFFETIFDYLKKNRDFSERKERILKIYYHIETMDNGLFCSSYTELSEVLNNQNSGNKGISPERARQLVEKGRFFIISGKSYVLKEKFFKKEKNRKYLMSYQNIQES